MSPRSKRSTQSSRNAFPRRRRAVVPSSSRATPRPKSNRTGRRSSPAHTLTSMYCMCLQDPFCCAPVRAPIPSPTSSFVARAILRESISIHSDGSFGLVAFPSLNLGGGGSIFVTVSGAGAADWAPYSYVNHTVISQSTAQARVLSFGIKVSTQVAATASPGFLYAGAVPALNATALGGLTPNTISSWPLMKSCLGSKGAFSIARPNDLDVYEFSTYTIDSGAGSNYDWSVPIIVGTNLPAGSSILVEVVLNLECLPGPTGNSSVDAAPDSTNASSLAEVQPSTLLHASRTALAVAAGSLDTLGGVMSAVGRGLQPQAPRRQPGSRLYSYNPIGSMEP